MAEDAGETGAGETGAQETDARQAPAADRSRFGLPAQLLHWAMAVLVLAMLASGAALVGWLGAYTAVLAWHKAVGLVVLVLAVLRIGNRIWRRPPPPPASLAGPERAVAAFSEAAMYALFLAQPVVGWALVSASGVPFVLGGTLVPGFVVPVFVVPPIAPVSIHLYGILRATHGLLAYALLVFVVAHIAAVLFHAVGLRDGLLSRMLPARPGSKAA